MASRRRRKSSSAFQDQLLDCTVKCQLLGHAHVVLRSAALGNLELFKHCSTICGNPWNISDETDRTPLHVAASCGSSDIVNWLLRRRGKHKRINVVDKDSYWSPLHRAAYFGYPGIMVQLIRAGANLQSLDKDKWTPLNVLQSNYVDLFPAVSEVSLYIWGNNANMTLGREKCRSTPELLETTPPLGNVCQVVLCKFHTLILTESGRVYSCGHGTGGRLGHGNENSVVSPKLIDTFSKDIVSIASARNHSVFLSDDGSVYSCGINDAQQLGHNIKTGSTVHSPMLIKSLKSKPIKLIGAGRYHTAVANSSQVFSFGKNLGQLGYQKTSNMQPTPKLITGISVDEEDPICQLSVSDAATACLTLRRHLIFVCTNYTVHRCERYNFPDTLSITQFVVCASLGELDKKVRDITSELPTGEEGGLKIALLDSENKLWFTSWSSEYSKKGCAPPKVIHGGTKYSVSHFSLTKNLTIVTTGGEVYTGPVSSTEPSLLDLSRIPLVQQAKRIFTDFKATNMAFLQNVYSPLELPLIEQSSLVNDVYNLLSEIELPHSVADVEFNINGSIFTANSLILSSNSTVFSSLFSHKSPSLPSSIQSFILRNSIWHLTINSFSSDIFQLFLFYMYGGSVMLEQHTSPSSTSVVDPSHLNSTSKSSLDNTSGDDTISTNTDWNIIYDQFGGGKNSFDQLSTSDDKPRPILIDNNETMSDVPKHVHVSSSWLQDVKSLLELAELFQVQSLIKRLNAILLSNGDQKSTTHCVLINELTLKPQSAPHDVVLVSQEGKEIKCHKCILVTRSDYFQSMLLRGWRESSFGEDNSVPRLELSINSVQLEILVHYLYKDCAPKLQNSTDPEFITSILVIADQFLLSRLKSICEHSLSKCINIRNVVDIMEFSMAYNSLKLQQTCLQFICNNLSVLLESGSLESLSLEILNLISDTYREMFSVTSNRTITTREPNDEELPLSYLQNKVLEFSDSEDDQKTHPPVTLTTRATTPTRSKSPLSDTSSNSLRRKKKKRANSLKDDKSNHSPSSHVTPPMSPDILPSLTMHTLNEEDTPIISDPININNGGVTSADGMQSVTSPCWGRSLSVPDSSSLKDIMEDEIKKHDKTKTKNNKSLNKPIPYTRNNTEESFKSTDRAISRRTRSESNDTNPWGSTPPSAQVSLRDLMAAEEKSKNSPQNRKKPVTHSTTISTGTSVQRSSSYEDTKCTIGKDQLVSFADIVSDQIKEMSLLSEQSAQTKKALHLIQIEEKAIEQLRELYKADNNFEEFVTIERIPAAIPINSTHKKKTTPIQSSVWAARGAVFK